MPVILILAIVGIGIAIAHGQSPAGLPLGDDWKWEYRLPDGQFMNGGGVADIGSVKRYLAGLVNSKQAVVTRVWRNGNRVSVDVVR